MRELRHADLGRRDAYGAQQLQNVPLETGATLAAVEVGWLGDLVLDCQQRVQRSHRVLEDHGDAPASDAIQPLRGEPEQLLAVEQDAPALDTRRTRQQAED